MRRGSNEPLYHHNEESDLNLRKGINGLKIFQTVDVISISDYHFMEKTPYQIRVTVMFPLRPQGLSVISNRKLFPFLLEFLCDLSIGLLNDFMVT